MEVIFTALAITASCVATGLLMAKVAPSKRVSILKVDEWREACIRSGMQLDLDDYYNGTETWRKQK